MDDYDVIAMECFGGGASVHRGSPGPIVNSAVDVMDAHVAYASLYQSLLSFTTQMLRSSGRPIKWLDRC